MDCGKVIVAENKSKHIKVSHNNQNVKFKFYNDSKQMKLTFKVQNVTCNNSRTTDKQHSDNEGDDILSKDCDNRSEALIMTSTDTTNNNKSEAVCDKQLDISGDKASRSDDGDSDNECDANHSEEETPMSDTEEGKENISSLDKNV